MKFAEIGQPVGRCHEGQFLQFSSNHENFSSFLIKNGLYHVKKSNIIEIGPI